MTTRLQAPRPLAPRRRWRADRCAFAAIAVVVSLGCAHAVEAQPPVGERGTIEVGGVQRTYSLYVPPALAHDAHAPLLVLFHGHYGTGADTLTRYQVAAAADRYGFIVVAPDGIKRGWNDGRGGSALGDQAGVDDAAFIVQLVAALEKSQSIDDKRVYAAGMSNGGIFAQFLGCSHGELFAGIASVASSAPRGVECTPSHPLRVAVIDGVDDPLVPYRGGDVAGGGDRGGVIGAVATVERWRQVDGCSGSTVTAIPDRAPNDRTRARVRVATGCSAETGVALVTIDGGGHEWPGARGALAPRLVGNRSDDFSATDAIMRYFGAATIEQQTSAFVDAAAQAPKK